MKSFAAWMVLGVLWVGGLRPAWAGGASCRVDDAAAVLSDTGQAVLALNARFGMTGGGVAARAVGGDARGVLASRLALVERLMREHPEEVRGVAFDAARAAALVAADPGAAALLERDGEWTGELTETVADDFEHGTASFHFHLHGASGDVELFPARAMDLAPLLHQRITVSGIATASAMALDAARGAQVQAQESGNAIAADTAALACSTTGVQKTVVLLLKFAGSTLAFPAGLDQAAYWQQAVAGSAKPSVTTFWNEVSYGQTSATVDVFGPLTLPQMYDCTTTSAMYTAAIAAAAGTVDFTQYTRIVLVYPAATCTFGGLGSIGCGSATAAINHPSSTVWIPILPTYNSTNYPNLSGDLTHELGHNLGLNHANTLDFGAIALGPLDFQATNPGTVGGTGATTASGAVTAVNTEYGDQFSTMGGSAWGSSGPYSAHHRTSVLQWIPSTDMRTVTAGGMFTVVPAENAAGLRSLRVQRDPVSSSWLWLEYHQPTGAYAAANLTANKGNNMTQGAMLQYENGFADPLHTYLLDMAPTAAGNNFLVGGLVAGKTWSDPYSLLDITTNAATATGLNVTITYATPCATLALSNAKIPAAGGPGTLTITAPATCAWTASSNATWLTLAGATSGKGNGTVAYTAAANLTQDQRNTYLTAQRQSLPLVQDGTTVDVLSVAPNNGTAAPGISTVFTLTFDDAAGIADVSQVNFYVGKSLCTVAAVLSGTTPYFYLLNGSSYTSGIAGGTVGTISSTACTLSGKNSGLIVSGGIFNLAMDLSFPAASSGAQAITSSISAKVHGTSVIPLGTFLVSANSQLSVSPSSGSPGAAVPVTLTGNGTHFGAASVVTVDSAITVTSVTAASATSMTATLNVAAAASLGTHTVTVTTGSEVVTAPFLVSEPVPALTLTASAAQAFAGNAVVLTVTASSSVGTPTGTVTFYDGTAGTPIGTATLTSGSATLSLTSLGTGPHAIGASYGGSASFAAVSTASTVAVTVSDFALAAPASGITVSAGAVTGNTASFTMTPGAGGFAAAIAFTCSGAPAASSCAVTPASVTPGASSATATVTITTTARAVQARTFSGLGLLCLPFGLSILLVRRRWHGAGSGLLLVLILLALGLGLNGCSGGTSGGSTTTSGTTVTQAGTPVGNGTLTITGTATGGSGTLTHTVTVTLTVN